MKKILVFFSILTVFLFVYYANDKKIDNSFNKHIFHQVNFGFNIGYLGEVPLYKKAISRIDKDGFKFIRVYEPFTKGLCKNENKIYTNIKTLYSKFNILLSLSNLPYKKINTLSKKINKMNSYTLRYYDNKDVAEYKNFFSDFKSSLIKNKIYNNLNIEIGNEPDAKNYFWNKNLYEFKNLKHLLQDIFYEKKITCCGFTSNKKIINNIEIQSKYGFDYKTDILSFHLYPLERDNGFPKPSTENSYITEFNLYSYYTKYTKTKNKNYLNNFELVIAKLLLYTKKYNIRRVYLFKLMDNKKNIGRLGFFDINGNPKEQYFMLLKLLKHIESGYTIKEDKKNIFIINRKNEVYKVSKEINVI